MSAAVEGSSRICVKSLPKNCTEKQLREVFSSRGEVTDLKLIYDKETRVFRKFAFIGFRSAQQAEEAQKYFNNSYIGMSKISVEIARRFTDPELVEKKNKISNNKSQKKQQKQDPSQEYAAAATASTTGAATHQVTATAATGQPAKVGKNKAEFMEIMKRRNQAASWGNDSSGMDAEAMTAAATTAAAVTDAVEEESDAYSSDEDAISITALEQQPQQQTATMSDLDYLRSKTVRHDSISDDDDNNSSNSDNSKNNESNDDRNVQRTSSSQEGVSALKKHSAVAVASEQVAAAESMVAQTTATATTTTAAAADDIEVEEDDDEEEDNARLFVKNLPFSCTEEEFTALVQQFGTISEVHLPIDEFKRGKGFGFVQFLLPEHAAAAQQQLSGSAFQGRVLFVVRAKALQKKDDNEGAVTLLKGNAAKLSAFQRMKEEERRKALNKREGWNAAHVRGDAVVETLAERHGVTAADILDVRAGGGELAVRLAIGESQVIMENKEYFALHGVDIDALESAHSAAKATQRSNTTLLVKNLPPSATAAGAAGTAAAVDELQSMFARFGALVAFLFPPSRTMALVEFVEPTEARAAFKGLAYRSFKHSPLYLEWAPTNTIDKKKLQQQQQQQQQQQRSSSADVATIAEPDNDNGDEDDRMYSSVFIKNLNFSTNDENLRDHLVRLGAGTGLRAVRIQKKTKARSIHNNNSSSNNNGEELLLSQGFGFAEYREPQQAAAACKLLHGSVLDSHALEVKPSDKRITTPAATTATAASSGGNNSRESQQQQREAKLIVRNVAFQATKSEIRALFAAYASVRRVRIPKKMNGEHRGFAFVDFASTREAESAVLALKSAHLYGRHLVIEWANAADDSDANFNEDPNNNYSSSSGQRLHSATTAGSAAFDPALEQLRKKARISERNISSRYQHL